jgi:hypothetical protein
MTQSWVPLYPFTFFTVERVSIENVDFFNQKCMRRNVLFTVSFLTQKVNSIEFQYFFTFYVLACIEARRGALFKKIVQKNAIRAPTLSSQRRQFENDSLKKNRKE